MLIIVVVLQLAWVSGCMYLIGDGLSGHGWPRGKELAKVVAGIAGLVLIGNL